MGNVEGRVIDNEDSTRSSQIINYNFKTKMQPHVVPSVEKTPTTTPTPDERYQVILCSPCDKTGVLRSITENHLPVTDRPVAYLIADVTPAGFRSIMTWWKENHTKYEKVYRLCIPYSASCSTPAEYCSRGAPIKEVVIGRLRNLPTALLYRHSWEEIVDDEAESYADDAKTEKRGFRHWPWAHTGSYMDVVGNASFGDEFFFTPQCKHGYSLVQERFFMEKKQNPFIQPFELCSRISSRYDLEMKRVWEACSDAFTFMDELPMVPTVLFSTPPRTVIQEFVERNDAMASPQRKPLSLQLKHAFPLRVVRGMKSISEFLTVTAFLGAWTSDYIDDLLEQRKQHLKDAADPKSATSLRQAFIQSLLYRTSLKEYTPSGICTYFDLSTATKQRYLRDTFGNMLAHEFGNITVSQVGRDGFNFNNEQGLTLDENEKYDVGEEEDDEQSQISSTLFSPYDILQKRLTKLFSKA
jgi:hypothetical protein